MVILVSTNSSLQHEISINARNADMDNFPEAANALNSLLTRLYVIVLDTKLNLESL